MIQDHEAPLSRALRASRAQGACLGFVIACLASAAGQAKVHASPSADAGARVIVVVRHAEADQASGDPGLSDAGQARAHALARHAELAGLTHVFVSQWRRTQQTAAPAARRGGLAPQETDAGDTRALAATLAALPAGSRALVVGHSNTVPSLVRALGGEPRDLVHAHGQDSIPHDAFDRMYVIRLEAGARPSLRELRYGNEAAAVRGDGEPVSRPARPARALGR